MVSASIASPSTALHPARAAVLVFGASCATLVLELVAGRLIAPYVGSSLYTWTTIIGVVLAGISLGNWLGGKIADRYPQPRILALLFLLAAAACAAVLGLIALLGDGDLLRPIPLLGRIFLLTTAAFIPASFVLGTITPVAIRLLLADVRRTGRVVGAVYALGTLGSLAGNYLTGFVLTAYFPTGGIVLGVASALVVLAALGGWGGESATPTPQTAAVGVAPPTPRERLSLAGNVPLACAVVFAASFCSMVVELAASRILAPHVGVSLYSWTGIIGVVLAGITVGNYLGGWIADRWPKQGVLGFFLFLGGLGCLSVLLAIRLATDGAPFGGLGLMERIVALTAAVFFVPALLLGTISPQVIKLAIADVEHAGRVAGRIYAWSTAGAIVGTFAAGWYLIQALGVFVLVAAVGTGLLTLALTAGRAWRSAPALLLGLLVAAGSLYGLNSRNAFASTCALETNYFCIRVSDTVFQGEQVRGLILDHLIHSFVKLDDPSFLGYEHEQVQAELTRYAAARTANPNVLVIGGGGYTYPRWVEAFVPQASIEVVEIDPGVTETAYRELGLPRETRIRSYNLDGRQFVHAAPKGHYQLVVQDAVNDLSVPYHLMTKEYNDAVKEILADDGIYLLTVIDLYEDGQLMRSAARTMMQTFPEVRLLGASEIWRTAGANVFVVAGSKRPIDLEDMRAKLAAAGHQRMRTISQPEQELREYVAKGRPIILTDAYAPVDNLISVLFSERG